MFSSTELIDALLRRSRRSLRPGPPPGEFPPAWKAWFAAMRERPGRVTGAPSEAIVAVLARREPALPAARMAELNRWQAFATLWRQEWQPVGRDGRPERLAAYAITLVIHLFLAMILLWLTWARIGSPPLASAAGEEVVQVQYIGEGTPQEPGGGAPAGEVPEIAPAAPPPAAAPAPAPSPAPAPQPVATQAAPQPVQPPPAPQPAAEPEPVPPAPAPPQSQPLQVTQSATPESTFTLPPASIRAVVLPEPDVKVPELRQPVRAIEVVEAPQPRPVRPLQPDVPIAQVVVPRVRQQVESLPQAPSSLPVVPARTIEPVQAPLRVPERREAVATLPLPATPAPPGQAPGEASEQATPAAAVAPIAATAGAGSSPQASARQAAGPPTPASGTGAPTGAAGAGPRTTPKPGAWPSARTGDDWGLSDRDVAGDQAGTPGLFDEQGRPRLPPGSTHDAGGGRPPGVVDEHIADLDRAGTWLKRPPIDYTPTRFDRFWTPSETLLQEWVRRNIRELSIPIPGSSKKLHCVISVLQLGGGCGLDDPNMSDQEATARPPPDIPFKPELQDDQGALGPPPPAP